MKRFIRISLWLIGILAVAVIALMAAFTFGNPRTEIELQNPVGFNSGSFLDEQRGRTLDWYSWYPTTTTEGIELIEENAVFRGVSAIPQAAMTAGKEPPLVVFSHGSGGNRANQAWLGVELARLGAIVVAFNHPGSTSRDSAPETNIRAWNRPSDVRVMISNILENEQTFGPIDPERIAVVGHSLGGYTALATAGAQLRLDQFIDYCAELPDNPDCAFYRGGSVDLEKVDREQFESDQGDSRVKAVVSIDPAFASSFDVQSLQTLAPTLLIAPHRKPGAVADLQIASLAQELPPQGEFVEIEGAHHFSFLPLCKPFGYYILDLVEEQAELLCAPEKTISRGDIHAQSTKQIAQFLKAKGVL